MLELNTRPARQGVVAPDVAQNFSLDAARRADADMRCWLAHTPSPLHRLPHLADAAGIGSLVLKDESLRLGMNSFKALGGAYAVLRLVRDEASRRLGRPLAADAIGTDEVRAIAATMTVSCATDGNHGRSVAEGAVAAGCKAVIFVHEGVDPERVAAIGASGARIVTVRGSYDDAVAEATRVCAREGWQVVSDTSWPGYETTPMLVMQGYTIIVQEVLAAMPEPPTHVFLQAGVGGFAAAVATHMALVFGPRRPRIVVVEPMRAACLFESNRAGALTSVVPGEPTCMAMLECYSPSMLAWSILSELADGFMTLEEDEAIAVMNRLARPQGGDPAVVRWPAGYARLQGDRTRWEWSTVPQEHCAGRRVPFPQGKLLGGGSSVNSMVHIRGNRRDYDNWAAQGNDLWSCDHVLPYFRKSEDNERFCDAYHATGGELGVSDQRAPSELTRLFVRAAQEAGVAHNPDFNGARLRLPDHGPADALRAKGIASVRHSAPPSSRCCRAGATSSASTAICKMSCSAPSSCWPSASTAPEAEAESQRRHATPHVANWHWKSGAQTVKHRRPAQPVRRQSGDGAWSRATARQR